LHNCGGRPSRTTADGVGISRFAASSAGSNGLRRRRQLLRRADCGDGLAHVGQAQWLDQISTRTGLHGGQRMARIVMSGKHDAGRRRGTSPQRCQQCQAIHAGKGKVAYHQVDAAVFEQRQRLFRCAGATRCKPQLLQDGRCQHPFHRTVIDHQRTAGNRDLNEWR